MGYVVGASLDDAREDRWSFARRREGWARIRRRPCMTGAAFSYIESGHFRPDLSVSNRTVAARSPSERCPPVSFFILFLSNPDDTEVVPPIQSGHSFTETALSR